MNQNVKLSKAISYVVIIAALLVFACIWPAGILKQTHVSKSNEIIAMESDPVNVEHNVTQMFVAEEGELRAVDLYVCNDMSGEKITFRLYDSSYTEIYNQFFVVKEKQEYPGFVHIPVGYDLIKDQEYYFTLEGLSADMIVAYEDRETSTSIVNGFMSYAGIEIQRYNVIIRYEYSTPFTWWQVLLSAVAILLVTSALLCGIRWLFSKKIADKEVKVHTVFRAVLNPLVILLGLILCLMIFPGRVFGTGVINYAFYGGSIVLLTGVLLYLINFKREGNAPLVDPEQFKENLPGYLQAFCIGMALWYCCEYMNGLYDIHHYYSERRMIVWFLLGILCTYSKKELLRIENLIYLLIASAASYFYVKPNLHLEEEGGLYQLDAYIMVIGGMVILLLLSNIIRFFVKKEKPYGKLCIPYVLFFAALLGMMVIFRNTREWVSAMAVLFALFYLRMWFWKKRDRILAIVGNGILWNFIMMVGYCLMHRPFNRYMFYRYGLGFHTVTVTGVYLALILSAAVVKFLEKYHRSDRLVETWKELLILSIANVYLLMTLTRTGYLASIVTEVLVIVLYTLRKEKWKSGVKCLGTILLMTLLCFPIVFTVTRMAPAVANDPVYADVEKLGYQVLKGMPADSEYYIDIQYFMKKAGIKMLGVGEEDSASALESIQKISRGCDILFEEAHRKWMPEDVFITDDSVLLASNTDTIGDTDSLNEISNGRIDIFKDYISQWNLMGHDEMGFPASFGGVHAHAHNVFLQVIHDHGLITGIIFILFGIVSFILALIRFVKKKDDCLILTIAVITAFAVSGMTEWNFHLCNPFGISLFMVMTPLLFKSRNEKQNE